MTRFAVWSLHVDYNEDREARSEPREVLEVKRTDRKTAEDDAALIRDVFKRKAWVQEEQP